MIVPFANPRMLIVSLERARRPHQPDRKPKAFDQQLLSAHPELAWVRDIAESTKHGGRLNRATVKVKEIRGAGFPGGTVYRSGPLGNMLAGPFGNQRQTARPVDECTLVIVLQDDSQHGLPEVLERAMAFWRQHVGKQVKAVYTVVWSPEIRQWRPAKVDDLPVPPKGAGWSLHENYWYAHAEACRRNSMVKGQNAPESP
jgi:hypothetical protein